MASRGTYNSKRIKCLNRIRYNMFNTIIIYGTFFRSNSVIQSNNQIRFLNFDKKRCFDSNDDKRPVEVEFYLLDSDGKYNPKINKEFVSLLDNHRFEYKSNVCIMHIQLRLERVIKLYWYVLILYINVFLYV